MKTGKSKSELPNELETIIWEKLKLGDTTALGELYDLYIDVLFSYGIQQSRDKGYIMDCIHDVFLDLYRYRANLAKTDNIKFYLFKSLKRKINKKYHRKIIPIQKDSSFPNNTVLENSVGSYEDDIILSEHTVERSCRLQVALNTLTKKQKKGLFLRFNQDRPYEEIADIMNVSIPTARTTIYRALKILRKHSFSLLILIKITFFR